MTITKELIPQIKYIRLTLENCEEFDIQGEDILDIYFEDFHVTRYNKDIIKADNGRLALSKNCFKVLSSFVNSNKKNGELESTDYFYSRIAMCCDVTWVTIFYKNGEKVSFIVEYNPLENDLWGCEIEYSNCPSAELDGNGDLLILFGKFSRAFRRTDNDYFNVIERLNVYLPKVIKGALKIELLTFGNGGPNCWNPDGGLFMEVAVLNKGHKCKYLPLVFSEVSNLEFNFAFGGQEVDELNVSTTQDGKLYVQVGDVCNFYCTHIEVFKGF